MTLCRGCGTVNGFEGHLVTVVVRQVDPQPVLQRWERILVVLRARNYTKALSRLLYIRLRTPFENVSSFSAGSAMKRA